MIQYFTSLDSYLKTFWFIAIPISVIFLIQTLATLFGSDGTDGTSPNFDGDLSDEISAPFQLFSLRNLTNFLLGLSWGGISFYQLIQNKFLLTMVALLCGFALMSIYFLVVHQIKKLAEDNTFKINNCLLKTGTVYIPIPPLQSGKGKIQISVQGVVHELDAVTESKERLETGNMVKVINIKDESYLLVEKI
jgi:hypothetical protein